MGGVWDGEIKAGGLPFEFSWLGVFYCKAFKSMDSSNYFFNQDISYFKKNNSVIWKCEGAGKNEPYLLMAMMLVLNPDAAAQMGCDLSSFL